VSSASQVRLGSVARRVLRESLANQKLVKTALSCFSSKNVRTIPHY